MPPLWSLSIKISNALVGLMLRFRISGKQRKYLKERKARVSYVKKVLKHLKH